MPRAIEDNSVANLETDQSALKAATDVQDVKSRWSREDIKKIAAFVLAVLNALTSAYITWPKSHEAALAQFVIVTLVALLAAEASILIITVISFTIMASCGLFYWKLPEEVPENAMGWLQPGDEATPSNACRSEQIHDGITVIAGGSAAVIANEKYKKFIVFKVGNCDVLSITKTEDGASIDATIIDDNGQKIGDLRQNKFSFNPKGLVIERSGDLTTLVVHRVSGEELIYVKYLNSRTFRVRGQFVCMSPKKIKIRATDNFTERYPNINNISITNNCAVNPGASFEFQ